MRHTAGRPTYDDKAPGYRVLDAEGLNGGPPPEQAGLEAVTPVSRFFTRNHAPIPAVDPASWRLRVRGLVREPLALSLADLGRRFDRHRVPATLVCAGLRREELARVRPIPGELVWGLEPAGTAVWGGVVLRDVLLAAGVLDAAAHVGLTGLDAVERHERRFGFGGSIPMAKAMAPEVLLADEMNGAPLTPLHGAPLRLVVPGYIGARSVKWLGEIELRAGPSENYFQGEAYRVQHTVNPADPRDVRSGRALGEQALNTVVLTPTEGATVPAGPVTIAGWAIGGGRHPLDRVEVSADGGTRWTVAELDPPVGAWTWQRWRTTVVLGAGPAEVLARAWDGAGTGQPERIEEVWNVKGYANNAWHRVSVRVAP